jgi:hypothetical protein
MDESELALLSLSASDSACTVLVKPFVRLRLSHAIVNEFRGEEIDQDW